MWQIMWMLSLLPDWFWHVVSAAGLIALFVPYVSRNFTVKVVGAIALAIGLFMEGGVANELKWQAKVQELEAKLKEAEEASNNANTQIQERVVEKTKIVKGKTEYITTYLDREIVKKEEIVKYIENCPLPKDIIDVHNQAATMMQEPKK